MESWCLELWIPPTLLGQWKRRHQICNKYKWLELRAGLQKNIGTEWTSDSDRINWSLLREALRLPLDSNWVTSWDGLKVFGLQLYSSIPWGNHQHCWQLKHCTLTVLRGKWYPSSGSLTFSNRDNQVSESFSRTNPTAAAWTLPLFGKRMSC